jgi:hypothetical protein
MIYHHLISQKLIASMLRNELSQLKFMRWSHEAWIFFLFWGGWSMDDCTKQNTPAHTSQLVSPIVVASLGPSTSRAALVSSVGSLAFSPFLPSSPTAAKSSKARKNPAPQFQSRRRRFASHRQEQSVLPPSDWLFLRGCNPWAPGAAWIRTRPRWSWGTNVSVSVAPPASISWRWNWYASFSIYSLQILSTRAHIFLSTEVQSLLLCKFMPAACDGRKRNHHYSLNGYCYATSSCFE